jgi:hypothetical protein
VARIDRDEFGTIESMKMMVRLLTHENQEQYQESDKEQYIYSHAGEQWRRRYWSDSAASSIAIKLRRHRLANLVQVVCIALANAYAMQNAGALIHFSYPYNPDGQRFSDVVQQSH